jgi:hypothetical protein
MTTKQLEAKIVELEAKIESLTEKVDNLSSKKGPSSTREMTIEDAERIINGDLKEASHKKAAEELGLSYGQVYSARGGYTFKSVKRTK